MSAEMVGLSTPIDADESWAEAQMDQWSRGVQSASDAATALVANWTEGKAVSRFWQGKSLREVMAARYPALSKESINKSLAVGKTKAALPADLTEGMTATALRPVGVGTTVPAPGGQNVSAVDPDKVERAKAVLEAARAEAGGPPTEVQVVQACREYDGEPETTPEPAEATEPPAIRPEVKACIKSLKSRGVTIEERKALNKALMDH